MPSFEYVIDEKERAGTRFLADVKHQLLLALSTEKKDRKLTQQAIAEKLGVHRSVVNRRFMGLENVTAKTIGEMLWAIGWEPHFEARKAEEKDGQNEFSTSSRFEVSGDKEVTLSLHGPAFDEPEFVTMVPSE